MAKTSKHMSVAGTDNKKTNLITRRRNSVIYFQFIQRTHCYY